MGKYDMDIKCTDVKKYIREKKYDKAYEVLQTIDITRIKSITDYKAFFEVYSNLDKYENAKEMLIRIYQINSSKRVLYQLVCLEIKAGQLEEAEVTYEDYLTHCKDSDDDALILRYLIDTAKHADYNTRIYSLEQLKKSNYYEEWAYELAKTYHKAGEANKCVKECEDIILWFGEGVIVEKAKMLRSYYLDGDTSFLKKTPKYKENVENVEKSEGLVYNTTDLGKQITDIETFDKQVELKNELKVELSLTQNIQKIQNALKQEKEEIFVPKNDFLLSGSEDTKTLKLESIQETLHEMFAKEEPKEELKVGNIDLTKIFGHYLTNKATRTELKTCFEQINTGEKIDCFYVTTENPNQNLDFVKRLAKALQEANVVKKSQVAKIKGDNLNHIQLEQRVDKLRNSILLIEGVESLYLPTVKALLSLMDELDNQLVIVFEDTRENVKIFQEEQYDLNKKNAYTINI